MRLLCGTCGHRGTNDLPREDKNMTLRNIGLELVAVTPGEGLLVINADDWGRDSTTTNRILDCCLLGAVSSVSAMVFMEDSERAAAIARERGIEAGLHLNFTAPFSASGVPAGLAQRQQQIACHLLRHRLAQIVFHPGLMRMFEYVAAAQLDEFRRLYGAGPDRIDGHHHMHLCANVLVQNLLPWGTMVRRNFSFDRGEKFWRTISIGAWWTAVSPAATGLWTTSFPCPRSNRQAVCEGSFHWPARSPWRWKPTPLIPRSIAISPAGRFFATLETRAWGDHRLCGRRSEDSRRSEDRS